MEIKKIEIENWKSLIHLELNNPNPFSVFVGPNASGKSNIFEGLDFFNFNSKTPFSTVESKFGGIDSYKPHNYQSDNLKISFRIACLSFSPLIEINYNNIQGNYKFAYSVRKHFPNFSDELFDPKVFASNFPEALQLFENFSRIFIGNEEVDKNQLQGESKLSTACGNLEKVLKRILKDANKRDSVIEWLQLLVPGLENIEIESSELSSTDSLLIYEKGIKKPFPKSLISDGTYNILALLAAIHQSDEPQFLLIEEPENGLNPRVIEELVTLFRHRCEEYGDFIWLNTHSQTLVRQLKEHEIIIVDKADGKTHVKQIAEGEASGFPVDEAWLTNTFGGGIPW